MSEHNVYKDALMHSGDNQAETLIVEAFDFAKSAKEKSGVPKKYITTEKQTKHLKS